MKRKPVSGSIREKISEENAFLKMKLMLEKGAQIKGSSEDIPPEVENEFLKYIMEFERQAENPSMITVFERIGKPNHFRPVGDISDDEIEEALSDLRAYLFEQQIDVAACSPNVTARELYRFIVEELFQKEIPDIRVPGMIKGFIYDEFYPDPVYENERLAVDGCLSRIFSSFSFDDLGFFRKEELQLNDHFPLSREGFTELVEQFKSCFDSIEDLEVTDVLCQVADKFSFVRGNYSFLAKWGNEQMTYTGKWLINLEMDPHYGDWVIFSVQIEGVNF